MWLAKFAWCLLLTVLMVADLFNYEMMAESRKILSGITPLIVCQNFLLLMAMLGFYVGLVRFAPCLDWSWLSLFSKPDRRTGQSVRCEGGNVHLIPARIKYFGLAYLLLLAVHVPRFARIEEEWFRQGTLDWQQGMWFSLLFGLAHCLVGVPLAAGLAIALNGLWLTRQYFIGGIGLSGIHHAAFNLTVLSLMFFVLILGHFAEYLRQKQRGQAQISLADNL